MPGGRDPSMQLDSNRKQDSNGLSSAERRYRGRGEGIHIASDEAASHEVVAKQKCSAIEIASSTSGEVKITMSCSSALGRSDFRLPSRDQLLKKMEDKCLQSYNITDPNFSIMKLLRDMCDCMLEFRTDSNDDSQEGSEMIPSLNVMKESKTRDALINRGDTEDLGVHAGTSNGSTNVDPSALNAPHISVAAPLMTSMNNAVLVTNKARSDFPGCDDGKGLEDPISSHSGSLVVVQPHQLTPDDLRSLHGTEDLSKGEENVKIPWVNDITNDLPPPFHYLHQSIAFRDAYVNWCLSKIKCEDYCSTCFGDCLQSTTPCVCANNVEGGYAYTTEGLLKEKFLEECINISRNPERHQFYCQVCPLERAKNDDCIEPCKGHLKRKFIKECWVKCGCVKRCGNRVVQRGITSNLQVGACVIIHKCGFIFCFFFAKYTSADLIYIYFFLQTTASKCCVCIFFYWCNFNGSVVLQCI